MGRSGGGAAAAGGMDFQNRVAAWFSTLILAETSSTPPLDLAEGTTLEWFRCETEQPVDDLLIGTSANGLLFGQAKRTVDLSESKESDLSSTLDQFVRQFLACREKRSGTQPWDRPLESKRDRLVLITSPSSSEPVRTHFPNFLRRLRQLHPDQTLEDAAINEHEKRALTIVRSHITASWKKILGVEPSDAELREILSLVRVLVLNVGQGGDGEREAKTLLRTVLRKSDEAETSWNLLITLCADLATKKSGASRLNLQDSLLNARLELNAPRSYQNDIEKIRKYSGTTLDALSHLAQIRIGATSIKIQRKSTEELCQAAEKGSIVVIGEPGAGKSGALHDVVETFRKENRDFIFFAVDRLASRSLADLRSELNLDHDFLEVLNNWPGLQPGFLVIDALDAARGDAAGTMVRELIRQILQKGGRWRVLASIREFDLRYGMEIRELFAGSPPTEFQVEEFSNVCHIQIPCLSEDELRQIASQSNDLQSLISSAPQELHELLRIPFNLRLMAELLGTGVAVQDLTPIKTRLELLDRYWIYRVIGSDGNRDARETVLRKTCEKMVESRALRIDRSIFTQSSDSPHLQALLSNQVLVEWRPLPNVPREQYILAFSHHVLFDYAVARLLLRGPPESVVSRLDNDSELAVVVRPSFLLHFQHLWTTDINRQQFWDLLFRIIRAGHIPEIGKLIGPSVAAELVREMRDLEQLSVALFDPISENRVVAEQALRHLIGALLVGRPGEAPLVGPSAGPWCHFLEGVSRDFRRPVAYSARMLLSTICERSEDLTSEQLVHAGKTARHLLEFAWAQESRDSWLVIHAIQCVCRTFGSDPNVSAQLIRRCLDPNHLSHFGFEEIPWLAREVNFLIPFDPVLVEEIYIGAFTYQESSAEPTPMGSGRILPLISNRQQDYQMGLYELARLFRTYLNHAAENGTRALIAITEAYVAKRHAHSSDETREEKFDYNGAQVILRTDYSEIWDKGTYHHDEPIKMINDFQEYLEMLASQQASIGRLHEIIKILVSKNRLAVLWRRLLQVATRYPGTLGKEILPFAWAMPILTGYDTTIPAGDFLKAIFSPLSSADRQRIEQTILRIPETVPMDRREAAEYIRNRLLGCLPDTDIVSEEARRLLVQLKTNNDVPSNESPMSFATWSGPYGEEEYLRDEGVPVDVPANRKIRELETPVKAFADRHLNSTPNLGEILEVFPCLQSLYKALSSAEIDGVHPKQCDHAWGNLAAACARIAKAEGLSCKEDSGSFVKSTILEAGHQAEPTPNAEFDAQFDNHPSWGSPSPRIEAAVGVMLLSRNTTCLTQDLLDAIKNLSNDPVPAVRYQIAVGLNILYRTSPDLMWQIIEKMSREELSRGVLQGLLCGPLQRLSGAEPDRIIALIKVIFNRILEGPGADEVRKFCVEILTGLYIWRDHTESQDVILQIATNPSRYRNEAPYLLAHRQALTHSSTNRSESEKDAIRHRALNLIGKLLHSAIQEFRGLEQQHSGIPSGNWPSEDLERAKSLARLIDHIGSEVYFSSGAFKRHGNIEEDEVLSPKQVERFYLEVRPILENLADVGLPSVTHHLLETLEYFIPIDPQGVFLCIGRVVQAGQRGGYQYESLAADLVVKLVERYLAEYRTILREDENCRRILIEILDLFVEAGWPSARRLTYRLEDIFR